MISNGWTIALYGSNVTRAIDASSIISFANLGVSHDPMTDNNWMKLTVSGLRPHKEQLKKRETYTGGISAHRGRRVKAFEIEIEFNFPDEMWKYFQLQDILDHKHVYLYKGDYVFLNSGNVWWEIHPDNYAIEIAVDDEFEDDFDNGMKRVTLNCRAIKPSPRPA